MLTQVFCEGGACLKLLWAVLGMQMLIVRLFAALAVQTI